MSLQWEAQVIGINYYPSCTKLNNLTAAANDAESIATQLENYGYETFRVQRLPRKPNQKGEWKVDAEEGTVQATELKTAITNLFNPPAPSKPPEMGLFFFSGHGWRKTVNGKKEVFLATSDVYPDTQDYGVALSWLGEQLQISPVQKLIIWLDCCYSGELFKYLDKIAPDKDYCLITATRSYEPGIEIPHQEGLFTKVLKAGLNPDLYPEGIVDSHKLAQYIQQRMAQTGQAPQVACSEKTIPLTIKFHKRAFEDRCPYRALSFFTENLEDALVFHGRMKLTQQLVEKVRNKERLIAVFGQSGSGKSSLLRAGLLYQLKLGQIIPGSNTWTYLELITPGDHPIERLRQAFKEKLEQTQEHQPIILIIDQFEECFTMCDEEYRQAFIAQLNKLLELRKNLQIILGMRSDFRSRLREHPQLVAQISKFNVENLSPEEIREAIEKPAQLVGLGIEGDLKQKLINDVEDYPGSLPLLQYTLTELWKEARAQKEKFLRLKIYQELGGIEGTLEKRADEVYASLSDIQKQVAKRIFLELTQMGEILDTSRRVSLGSLVNSHYSYKLLDKVTRILANRENRLISRTEDLWDKDKGQDDPEDAGTNNKIILDVVHEALIRNWGQLREWQEQYRDGMPIERKIEAAAEEWLSNKKKSEYLFQGDRLAVAELYLENYGNWGMLDGIAEEFITESQNLRTQQKQEQDRLEKQRIADLAARTKAEELARIEAEKRETDQRKANKKLLIWSTVAVTFGIVASFLGISSFFSSQEVRLKQLEQQANNIKVKLSLFNDIEYLWESIELAGDNQKFNQRSFKTKNKLLPKVQSVLYQAVEESRERYVFKGHEDSVLSVALSSDGKYLVSGSADRTVKLWSVENQSLVHTFKDHQSAVNSVAFSPDGNYLVSGSDDKTVKLWRGTDWQDWLKVGCERIRLHSVLVSRKTNSAQAAANTCIEYGNWSDIEKAEFLVKQGLVLAAEEGYLDLAKEKFQQASKLDPTNVNLADLEAEANNLAAQTLINQGMDLAQNFDLKGVQEKFQQASKLDPTNVNLAELKAKANQLEAQTLIDQGKDLAAINVDLKGAYGKFQQASKLDPENVDLAELETEAQQLAAQTLIEKGIDQVRQGNINVTEAISLYNQVQNINPNLEIDAKSWNSLCWFGSIYRQAKDVLFACEQAVQLASDEASQVSYLDSRGLARALTGNTQGAIKDFQAYVNSRKFGEEDKNQVKQWLELLKKGENPFTDEALEDLKMSNKAIRGKR